MVGGRSTDHHPPVHPFVEIRVPLTELSTDHVCVCRNVAKAIIQDIGQCTLLMYNNTCTWHVACYIVSYESLPCCYQQACNTHSD